MSYKVSVYLIALAALQSASSDSSGGGRLVRLRAAGVRSLRMWQAASCGAGGAGPLSWLLLSGAPAAAAPPPPRPRPQHHPPAPPWLAWRTSITVMPPAPGRPAACSLTYPRPVISLGVW